MLKLLQSSRFLAKSFSTSVSNRAKVTLYEPTNKTLHFLSLLLKQSNYISHLKFFGQNNFDDIFLDLSHINTAPILSRHNLNDSYKALEDTDIFVIYLESNKFEPALIEPPLSNLLKIDKQPFVIFFVEPLCFSARHAKNFLLKHNKYFANKFLIPFTHVSGLINTIVAQKLKIGPELLNCFTSDGTIVENSWPLIEENNPKLSKEESQIKIEFYKRVFRELNNEYENLMSTNKTPSMLIASALNYYINSLCYAIDVDTVVTLNSIVDFYIDDDILSHNYFKSSPVLINKNGIVDLNYSYHSAEKNYSKVYTKFENHHLRYEKELNKVDKDEILI